MKSQEILVFPLRVNDSDGKLAIYSKGMDLKELFTGFALAGYALGGTIMGFCHSPEQIAKLSVELVDNAVKELTRMQ